MMISRWAMRLGVAVLATLMGSAASWASERDFLDPAQAFVGSARVSSAETVELRIEIAPDYHLYRDRISVDAEGSGATLSKVSIPAGKVEFDENFQQNVEVLQGTLLVHVLVHPTAHDFRLRVVYQGCADKGLCYPPQTAFVDAVASDGRLLRAQWRGEDAAPVATATVDPATAAASITVAPASQATKVESALKSGSLISIAGVFLLAGLLLAFTPCVLPMVPILSSIIVGQGAPVSRVTGFAMAMAYSLGMALVYTVFGVIAGLLGEGLAAALQNPWVLGAFALMLATLSLSMFGVFELQMPSFIQSRITERSSRLPGGSFVGVFVMGGLSALIVGPCVAAPLAGALVFISQTRDIVIGGLALFSLAMGMSVPLLLVGVSAGSLLPRAGSWMEGVKTFFGVMLLAVALWIVAPVLPGWVVMLIIGSGMLMGAIYLKLLDRLADSASGRQRLLKGLALLLAVFGSTQVVGALSGGDNPLQPLSHWVRGAGGTLPATQANNFRRIRNVAELDAALKTTDRPVMLDFYADWCVSCKEMEHLTFSDPAVHSRMANALLLQTDVTDNSTEARALLKRFGLFGPPGVLFFDKLGREQVNARVVGFVPAQEFAKSLAAVGL